MLSTPEDPAGGIPILTRMLTLNSVHAHHQDGPMFLASFEVGTDTINDISYQPLILLGVVICTTCGLPEDVQEWLGDLDSDPLNECEDRGKYNDGTPADGRLPTHDEVLDVVLAEVLREFRDHSSPVTLDAAEVAALRAELDEVLRTLEREKPWVLGNRWSA